MEGIERFACIIIGYETVLKGVDFMELICSGQGCSGECNSCKAYFNYFKCNTVFFDPTEDESQRDHKYKMWLKELTVEECQDILDSFQQSSYYQFIHREIWTE